MEIFLVAHMVNTYQLIEHKYQIHIVSFMWPRDRDVTIHFGCANTITTHYGEINKRWYQ